MCTAAELWGETGWGGVRADQAGSLPPLEPEGITAVSEVGVRVSGGGGSAGEQRLAALSASHVTQTLAHHKHAR